ncbi:hypothetical protein [Alcaligenes faecalis]|uniref:hypothetical protein n=1 Tax=Alcaligenes faecalis TaxID=511 RepID=UPI0006921E26|nr:hypothetical protein [Alcaligenes faecalis]
MEPQETHYVSKLDRELQRHILTTLARLTPLGTMSLLSDMGLEDLDESVLQSNLTYLEDHGLLRSGFAKQEYLGGDVRFIEVKATEITAKGQDFLLGDGGLSAILGVVTIRLHDDTIKELIQLKIMKSDLPPADKKRFVDSLKELPAETTKHLVMKLVDLGLDQLPMAGLLGLVSTAAAVAPT